MLDILDNYQPITLEEMSGIRLMNRTDTKFVTTTDQLRKLLKLAVWQYRVQEIDSRRIGRYYTLYFDTPDYNMFGCHHAGHTDRQKLRIRSYVDSGLNFLEVKTKNNHGRTKKKRTTMFDFDPMNPTRNIIFDRHDETFAEYDEFLRQYLRYSPDIMGEKIENRFNRITLVNNMKTERLTIDTSLCFHNIATGLDVALPEIAIIELKRDGLVPSPILGLLRELRIKPMGFSKYCMGSALTNPGLKQNRFKPRLHAVERLRAGITSGK